MNPFECKSRVAFGVTCPKLWGTISILGATSTAFCSALTTIDVPGAVTGTETNGINDRGQIVGDFSDASGNFHGYLLSAGSFTTFDFPGAFSVTAPFGISSNGQIVGSYDGSPRGFGLGTHRNFALWQVLSPAKEELTGFYPAENRFATAPCSGVSRTAFRDISTCRVLSLAAGGGKRLGSGHDA